MTTTQGVMWALMGLKTKYGLMYEVTYQFQYWRNPSCYINRLNDCSAFHVKIDGSVLDELLSFKVLGL